MPVAPGACDVWIARGRLFAPHARRLEAVLCPAERAHVGRFRRKEDRAEARLSRSLLRILLSRYLEVEPCRVPLDRRCPTCGGPHGKPRLAAWTGLEVSVSHSGDLLVLAVTSGTPVGVDVEHLPRHPEPPSHELLELACAPAERRRVWDAPPHDRGRMFLSYWTGKEAVVKMTGAGLACALPDVHLPPPGQAGSVKLADGGWGETEVWTRPLDVGPAHLATLASARELTDVRIAQVPLTLLAGGR